MSTLAEIQAVADALPSEQKQELMRLLAARLHDERAAGLDLAYEHGYSQTLEDISLSNALLPHLAVDGENWE